MSVDTNKYDLTLQQVVNAKAAWRKHAQSLTWEDKVAAIERMRGRDAELKKVREQRIVDARPQNRSNEAKPTGSGSIKF